MAPARLGEAATQDLVLAVEEQQLRVVAFAAPRGGDLADQIGRIERAGPAIDADREVTLQAVPRPDQAAEQGHRQVVDRLEAEVLQRLQRRGPTSARHSGDQDDLAQGAITRPVRPRAPV